MLIITNTNTTAHVSVQFTKETINKTNLSFGLYSRTTGAVFSFQSFMSHSDIINHSLCIIFQRSDLRDHASETKKTPH